MVGNTSQTTQSALSQFSNILATLKLNTVFLGCQIKMGLLKQFMQLIFTFLLLASEREIEVKAGSFPLPDILDSPHIKNQSAVYCGGECYQDIQLNFLRLSVFLYFNFKME